MQVIPGLICASGHGWLDGLKMMPTHAKETAQPSHTGGRAMEQVSAFRQVCSATANASSICCTAVDKKTVVGG